MERAKQAEPLDGSNEEFSAGPMNRASHPPRVRLPLWLGGLAFAAVGAALYHITVFPYVYPGESAAALSQHLGASPFHRVREPLWGWLARAIDGAIDAPPWTTLNLLSGLCAAASLFFVHQTAALIPHDRSTEERLRSDKAPAWLPHLCGAAAAGWLLVCTSWWFAATRATPLTLAMLILLVCAWLLVLGWRRRRTHPLYPACLLYGLGLAECPTFLILLPFFALGAVHVVYLRHEGFRPLPVLAMSALGLLGLSIILPAGQALAAHPSAPWMFVEGYGDAVTKIVTLQLVRLRESVPRIGWLTLAVACVVPGLVVLVPKRLSRLGMAGASMVLHAVCTAISMLILFNGFAAPWTLFRAQPLFLAPVAFTAVWTGYLAGYWWLRLLPHRIDPGWLRALRRAARWALPPALAAAVVGAGWLARPQIMSPGAPRYTAAVRAVLDDLGHRDTLISNAGIEEVLRLEARERGQPLTVLNPALGAADSYRNWLRSLHPDLRLQSFVNIGVNALVVEQLKTDPLAAGRLASLTDADLLHLADLHPLPRGRLFVPAPEPAATTNWWTGQRATFEAATSLPRDPRSADAVERFLARWRTHLSKVANNCGVHLQQADLPGPAREAYADALRLDDRNLSALLNLANLDPAGPDRDARLARVREIVGDRRRPPNVWALGYHFGFVHDPGAYLDRGMAWALSGKPRLAAREMERALGMVEDSRKIRLELAAAYFAAEDLGASETAYNTVLARDPDDIDALLGLARLAILRADYDSLDALTARLRALDPPALEQRLMQAGLAVLRGEDEAAMEGFRAAAKLDAEDPRAWAGIAMLAQKAQDDALLADATARMGAITDLAPAFQRVHAQLLTAQGQLDDARVVYRELLRAHPRDAAALEALLRLDLREQEPRPATAGLVRDLLRLDPDHAFANYVRGVLHLMEGRLELARAALETSLRRRRDPETLNTLAWTLWSMGEHGAALPFAREAVETDPGHAAAWDTLGVVQRSLGQPAAAEQSLLRAVQLRPANIAAQIHLAQTYADLDKLAETRQLVRDLEPLIPRLAPTFQGEYRELVRRLRPDPPPDEDATP